MFNGHLHLNKFDMSSIPDNAIVLIIGKRYTGKTTLVKDLLFYHRDIPVGVVMSTNNGFPPNLAVHDEYSSEIIENIFKRHNDLRLGRDKSTRDHRAVLVLDHVLFDHPVARDNTIRKCFTTSRHHDLLVVISVQWCIPMPPTFRENIDYVFLFKEYSVDERRRLYRCYAGMFPTFDMFCQAMDACTQDYDCLVINNRIQSDDINDQVFWYRYQSIREQNRKMTLYDIMVNYVAKRLD